MEEMNKDIFKLIIDDEDLTDATEEVLKKYKEKSQDSFIFLEHEVKYKLQEKTIRIEYNGNEYTIETEPYKVYLDSKNEENLLGKYYNYDEKLIRFINYSKTYFDLFIDQILIKDEKDIKTCENRDIIIKKKEINDFIKFEYLNKKNKFESDKKIRIYKNKLELSPMPLEELNYIKNEKFTLVLDQRNKLIEKIGEFINYSSESKLDIYGCDGIGKTITYIYLSNLTNSYKVLYFNVKTITLDEKRGYDLFVNEIMRFYTINKQNKEKIKRNFQSYKKIIKDMKKKDFNFWEEIEKFIKLNIKSSFCLIIFDQFKEEDANNNGLEKIEKLLFSQLFPSFKIIVSYSVNNSKIKENLINHFQSCSLNSPLKVYVPDKNEKLDNFEENFDQYFLNINFEKQNYNDEYDDKLFEKVNIFNFEINQTNNTNNISSINEEIKGPKKNESNEIHEQINLFKENELYEDSKNIENQTNLSKIIYINSLISLRGYIKDSYINYLDLFNYYPKYYVKFKNYALKKENQNKSLEEIYIQFLDRIYFKIKEKLKKFVSKKGYNDIFSNNSIILLIKIKDLVENQISFTSPILIEYLKKFPMKYLKIKIKDKEENNIIELNGQFEDKQFFFEYCFPFFGIIISKIIYMNENFYSINYTNLTGCAIGSFIVEKLKKAIVYDKCLESRINIRYVWKFIKLKNNENFINKIDYITYKPIVYDDKITNLRIEFTPYYIVPGCQINESLDSAILIPELINYNFNLITIKATKDKVGNLKKKQDYINASFQAKKKFEELYDIVISKVYFFFILTKEFIPEETIMKLKEENIEYLFFSFADKSIYDKNNEKINLQTLINKKAIIMENEEKEEENFEKKEKSIIMIENYLKRKRQIENKIISRNVYENARLMYFKKDKGLKLTNFERNIIIQKLKGLYLFENTQITIKYVFKIKFFEINKLIDYNNLLGIFVDKKKNYIYYKSIIVELDDNEKKINTTFDSYFFVKVAKQEESSYQKSERFNYPKKSLTLKDIENEKDIFVFKIYHLS